jgi:ribulose-5-phosphate 4-epimerase/fuculose-1-phosphate aldolase
MSEASSLSEAVSLLVVANHILAREGVVDAFGHVSLRHPEHDGRYLLSCSRSPEQVRASDIMAFELDGRTVGDDARRPYLERFIHGGVYEARPDLHAVVHSHSAELIPYGVTNTPIRPLMHVAGCIGRCVPVWDMATLFGDATSLLVTDMAHSRDLARTLGDGVAVLMRGHGAVIAGRTLQQAVLAAVYLQLNAAMDLQARALGEVRYLSDGEIDASPATLFAEGPCQRAWDYFAQRAQGVAA